MSLCNAMGWLAIDWNKTHAWFSFGIFTLLIIIGYVFLVFYWKGRNWARIAVLLTSVLAISNLRYWNRGNRANSVMILSEAMLGLFLLFWLNTKTVSQYFKKPQSEIRS